MTDVVIARAIFDAGLWPGAWGKANEVERNDALFKARAALAALNEAGYVVVERDHAETAMGVCDVEGFTEIADAFEKVLFPAAQPAPK